MRAGLSFALRFLGEGFGTRNRAFIPYFKVLSRFCPFLVFGFLHGVIVRFLAAPVFVFLVAGLHQQNKKSKPAQQSVQTNQAF